MHFLLEDEDIPTVYPRAPNQRRNTLSVAQLSITFGHFAAAVRVVHSLHTEAAVPLKPFVAVMLNRPEVFRWRQKEHNGQPDGDEKRQYKPVDKWRFNHRVPI